MYVLYFLYIYSVPKIFNEKKKILVINNSLMISGAEFSLLSILDALEEQYQVIVGIPGTGPLYEKLLSGNHSVEFFLMSRYSGKKNIPKQIRYLLAVIAASLKMSEYICKNQVELVYFNSIQSVIYAPIIKFLTKSKLVWHVRDNVRRKIFGRLFASVSDHMICVSKYIYDQLPGNEKKMSVIYNGIDLDKWKPFSDAKVPKPVLYSPIIHIGNVGQLIPWKNHLDLLKVIKRITLKTSNVRFIILGDDLFNQHSPYVDQIRDSIKQNNIEQYISFLGFQDDIVSHMGDMDILLHCAIGEPFGRVIMEAMALQIPVVAYDSGGIREQVVNDITGYLVQLYNYKLMTEKLALLIANKDRRLEFGLQARKEVENKFAFRKFSKEIQGIISQLI